MGASTSGQPRAAALDPALSITLTLALSLALALAGGSPGVAGAGQLIGTAVFDQGSAPAAGVWITVTRVGDLLTTMRAAASARVDRRQVFTDADGRFAVRNLPAGQYEVSAAVDSLSPWLAAAGPPLRAVIAGSDDRATVEVTLTHRASLTGEARHRGGGPLVDARIEVFHHGDPTSIYETRSDARGRFTVPGLERGVQIDLVATTPEGLYTRLTTTPLRAGSVPVSVELPPWDGLAKRPVVILVSVPTTLGQRLQMDWSSRPEDAREGFHGTFDLDRDGRGRFLSPVGIFQVRVHEVEKGGRSWVAPRLVRVEPGNDLFSARVDVELVP
jgi:hypothetical protein